MRHDLGEIIIRPLEDEDLDALHVQRNDPEIASMLWGFGPGYSKKAMRDWLEYHRNKTNEIMWAVHAVEFDACIGHLGLYEIDYRIGQAEPGLMIGDRRAWGRKWGPKALRFGIEYGFYQLNLRRMFARVLVTNERALAMDRKIGFKDEGLLRQAQYKDGEYIDVVMLGLMRDEYVPAKD